MFDIRWATSSASIDAFWDYFGIQEDHGNTYTIPPYGNQEP